MRADSKRSHIAAMSWVLLATIAASLLAGCETDVDNSLHIRNSSGRAIDVEYELASGERVRVETEILPGRETLLLPPNDPDVDERERCTSGPLIVLQDGREIQRFEAPVCYGDGLTLDVDGEP